jgi:nitroreductase
VDERRQRVRPLLRTRQFRQFTSEPVTSEDLDALADVARWSGSSSNSQPWRFILIRDLELIRRLGEIGHPQTRSLATAMAAIAIVMPDDEGRVVSHAYDDGRAAERILIGAEMLGLGAGIAWITTAVRPAVSELLGLPAGHYVRTIVAAGHPTEVARQPKSAPGTARLPRDQVVMHDHWR